MHNGFCLNSFLLRWLFDFGGFLFVFLMWTIFKVFIECVTILLLLYAFFFPPQGMWDLSSLIRDGTHSPCIERQSLKNRTTREVPLRWILNGNLLLLIVLLYLSIGTPLYERIESFPFLPISLQIYYLLSIWIYYSFVIHSY